MTRRDVLAGLCFEADSESPSQPAHRFSKRGAAADAAARRWPRSSNHRCSREAARNRSVVRRRNRLQLSRISSSCAAYGTIRAIGVSRSSTVSVLPLRTERRYSLRRAFSSAIPTSLMANYSHKRSRPVRFGRTCLGCSRLSVATFIPIGRVCEPGFRKHSGLLLHHERHDDADRR